MIKNKYNHHKETMKWMSKIQSVADLANEMCKHDDELDFVEVSVVLSDEIKIKIDDGTIYKRCYYIRG